MSPAAELFPNADKSPESPQLPADFVGVHILGPTTASAGAPVVIRGFFRVEDPPVPPLHPRLALVVAMPGDHVSALPFQGFAALDGDASAGPAGTSGFFNFDAAAQLADRDTGGTTWYVSVSLGLHVSNVLAIQVFEGALQP